MYKRQHLQDATPIKFSQEISGWRASLERDVELLKLAAQPLHELALGGTAVGTGLNAPKGFSELVAAKVAELTGIVLTKLDGSSKGGIIVSICNELSIPVRLVGVGEGIGDMQPFSPEDYVRALFE